MEAATADQRLTTLFDQHYDEVLAYCARRIGRNEADEAAAEVFAIAWRRSTTSTGTRREPGCMGSLAGSSPTGGGASTGGVASTGDSDHSPTATRNRRRWWSCAGSKINTYPTPSVG